MIRIPKSTNSTHTPLENSCGLEFIHAHDISYTSFFSPNSVGLDLDQLTEADPAWMTRLSLPFSTDYKDNVVSPGAPPFPLNQESTSRDEPHTFETFGKATGRKLNAAEPRLASTFLSEMNTLFEIILAQNVSPQRDSSLEFFPQVQKCSKILDVDEDTVGA